MTITVTKTEVRPSTSVDFFYFNTNPTLTEEAKQYWNTNYVLTNKWLGTQVSFSPDLLTRTMVLTWSSQEDFDSFMNDAYMQENLVGKNVAWNSLYGISRDIVIT